MTLTDADVSRIALAVADELERRQQAAAAVHAQAAADARRAHADRLVAEREAERAAAHVDASTYVFADFDDTGYQKVTRSALRGKGLTHVGDRTGTNPDGTPYSVRCYRKAS